MEVVLRRAKAKLAQSQDNLMIIDAAVREWYDHMEAFHKEDERTIFSVTREDPGGHRHLETHSPNLYPATGSLPGGL